MRNEMLFIDGELVDLGENTKITLNLKSNLLSDLSKIVSNNSYTIRLPKTVRNQRIIKHADIPSCSTVYPRKYHHARYFRNGVEIISNAKAVLLSVSDTIDIAITWGNITLLAGIVENDKSLNELIDNDYYMIWRKEISDYQNGNPFIVSDIDMGIRGFDTLNYVHPSVRANWILERISSDNGVNFLFSNDVVKEFINKLIIPLLTRHGRGLDADNQFGLTAKYNNGVQYDYNLTVVLKNSFSNNFLAVVNAGSKDSGVKILKDNTKIRISAKMFFDFISTVPVNPAFVAYKVVDGRAEEVFSADASNLQGSNGQTWTVYFDFKDETSILSEGDIIYFAFRDTGYFVNNWGIDTFSLALAPYIDEVVVEGQGSDGYYPIISNLPDIKQVDFIKMIAAISGTFAVVVNDTTLGFFSVDDIMSKRHKAYDWTRKVVASFKENKPQEISYSLDDFAQHNLFRWKDDIAVKGDYNSALYVEDETIEMERIAIELPFAATDMSLGRASIPLYDYSGSETIGEMNSVEPRLLIEVNNTGKSKASFEGLKWETLLRKNYGTYQKIIRSPIVVSEKIEISDIELKELDVTIPVYLGQYGRYYAIISVRAENTGICECSFETEIAQAYGDEQEILRIKMEQKLAELNTIQQLEGESIEAFNLRKLQAQNDYNDAKKAVTDKEIAIEQAKYDTMATVTNGLIALTDEIGNQDRNFAIASKALALAEIAINTGKAISKMVSAEAGKGIIGLGTMASGIATILSNIAAAISTVKSAKFAQGGSVVGPGSATSDSIPAMLSNGESVMTAAATSMFAPLLSAFNQMGGGIPINVTTSSNQATGEDMLAKAVARGMMMAPPPVLSVEEFTSVADRVKYVENLGSV